MVQLTPLQKHKAWKHIWHFSNVSFSFFFFNLPEKAETCQFLCNNSQVSQTPAACPAERLPWDLVGAG